MWNGSKGMSIFNSANKSKIALILFFMCLIMNSCIGKNTIANNLNNDNSNNITYSFLKNYPDVGSYELVKKYETAGGKWYSDVDDIYSYAWSQCLNVWNSYISLYEASGDLMWLEKLSYQIDEILNKRDIITGKVDRNGFSLPSWSWTADDMLYKSYHNPVMNGIIIYPILRFVEVVRKDKIFMFAEKSDEYLQASIDALSVLDLDVDAYNGFRIPKYACQNMWRERLEKDGTEFGYYVGHNYYNDNYFKENGFVSGNPLPYNQCLAVVQCYPVLYRLLGDTMWKDKTFKAWNWFKNTGFEKSDDISWWYYSEYYNWCKSDAEPIRNVIPPEDGNDYYEDFEGHYSIDLMFIIEAHKIGVINNNELMDINNNKKKMGLSAEGWPRIMNVSANGKNNLKTAVYFDYFVSVFEDYEYEDIVFPVLREELERQYCHGVFADNSTNINGTCLRLLTSAYISKKFR